jgi:hypothetical protein
MQENKIEPVFESELRVIKNGKVIETEKGDVKNGEYDHDK